MNIFRLFLSLLAIMLMIVILLWIFPQPEAVTGIIHPDFESMRHSGQHVATTPASRWLSLIFGAGVLLMLGFGLIIGFRRKNEIGPAKWWLATGVIVYLAVYFLMVASDWSYSKGEGANYFFGFPAPTAWMIYGVWLAPLFFTLLYIWKFDQWILDEGDLETYERLLEERHQSTE